MIRIGDFSRLSRVSVKTLRYYDELGLIKPVHVDSVSGYRYYAPEQYQQLTRVLALKDLGFSLDQIGRLLAAGVSNQEMRGMLLLRQAEAHQSLLESQGRLQRIEAWLMQLEREDVMSNYEVVIKKVDAMKVAAVRGTVPSPPEQCALWDQLGPFLQQPDVNPSGPCLTLYYDEAPKEQDWDIEVCAPILGDVAATEPVSIRELPAVETMATVVHRGPFMTIGEAYAALQTWVSSNGYQVIGPLREITINATMEQDPKRIEQGIGANQSDPSTVVEIQFPVSKN